MRIRIISAVMESFTPTKACSDERVQDISLGACNSIDDLFLPIYLKHVQNPDEPDKKPRL